MSGTNGADPDLSSKYFFPYYEVAMRGRPKAQLDLSQSEHEKLTALTRQSADEHAMSQRARIILACALGLDNNTVAIQERVTAQTVSKWRGRFVAERLDGLRDAPRCGAPRTINDAQVKAVVNKTLYSLPQTAKHWSTRAMAREMGMSQTAICRIWRAFSLHPHRLKDSFDFRAGEAAMC
jgi:transposase